MPTWTRRALKDLESIPEPMRGRVRAVAGRLDEEPGLGTKLKGKLTGNRSARVGRSYRIIYQLDTTGPLVKTVRPTRDSYR